MMNFDEWWSKYCKISSLNIEVDRLKEDMKLAFYNRLPSNHDSAKGLQTELVKVVNKYIKNGLKKPAVTKSIEWVAGNIKFS